LAPALVVAGLLFGVLLAVIVADQVAAGRHRRRAGPSALERIGDSSPAAG